MESMEDYDAFASTLLTSMDNTSVAVDGGGGNRGWSVSGIENSVLVRTAYGLISFSGMAGNALVCIVLLRLPALRTRTSQFIINLAVTDFVNSFWLIPFHLFPSVPPVPSGLSGELMCRVYISKYIMWSSSITSVYCLVSITMERYFAVVHPLRYKVFFTPKLSFLIGAACWGIGLLSTIFFFFIYAVVDGKCTLIPYPNVAHQMIVGVWIFTVIYGFPIAINLIWHGRIIQSLKRQAKAIEANARGANDAQHPPIANVFNNHGNIRWQLKTAQDLQRTFFLVILVFMLCWAPNQFLFLAYNLGADVDFTKQYYHFTVILAMCNSCVNPFIYVFKHKTFRRGIVRALRCTCVARPVHPYPTDQGHSTDGGGTAFSVA
ncbi:somatostatin receptor type 5-like [Diadema antillarum]|uniref:somatostatin receptor type 5-like n=1 Tax=Diadema antillarum TaxID=105358 RepID=UPI003A8AA258